MAFVIRNMTKCQFVAIVLFLSFLANIEYYNKNYITDVIKLKTHHDVFYTDYHSCVLNKYYNTTVTCPDAKNAKTYILQTPETPTYCKSRKSVCTRLVLDNNLEWNCLGREYTYCMINQTKTITNTKYNYCYTNNTKCIDGSQLNTNLICMGGSCVVTEGKIVYDKDDDKKYCIRFTILNVIIGLPSFLWPNENLYSGTMCNDILVILKLYK